MKTKLLLPALFALILTAASAADKPAAPAAADPKSTDATEAGKDKKKMIEKGMTGDQITELFGKPKEIKAVESPDPTLKVEQWIYRRQVRQVSVQVPVGTHTVPSYSGFSGPGAAMTEAVETDYRQQLVTVYQVTALLMVNGKLQTAKQWNEQDEKQE